MTQLSDEFYAILKPFKRSGIPVNGQRPVREFKVERIRRDKPYTDADEVAVKLVITLDSTLFDEIIPTVNIELGAKDLFVNTEVQVEPVEADRYEATGE